jgi:hypothetical protein
VSTSAKPRTLIVCLPADTAGIVTATAAVADHLDGPPKLTARFPVRHRHLIGWVTRWLTYRLVGVRRRRSGMVTWAAGGRVGRLNLAGAAGAAYLTAVARWAYWRQVTAGTREASPWEHFLRRHRADPEAMPLDEARRRFLAQPRIQAMQIANAVPGAVHHLDPYEVDAYQSGHHAYATRHQLGAVAGDAMLTADGQFLQPASEAFTDVIAYLTQAAGHVHRLGRRHQLVAMTI